MSTPSDRYRDYLETLTPETLADLSEYVVVDVRFKDPFNDVRGADAMANIFRHMFDTVGPVRFIVDDCAGDADTCMMSWRFEAILRGRPWTFDGTSVIKFAADGRVVEHVDHWDSASAFYERLPIIGSLLAAIRRRLATG